MENETTQKGLLGVQILACSETNCECRINQLKHRFSARVLIHLCLDDANHKVGLFAVVGDKEGGTGCQTKSTR